MEQLVFNLFLPLRLQEWFTVFEHNRRPNCTVSDLIMGNEYTFRVFSENICGRSDEAGLSKNTAVIGKTGDVMCAGVPVCVGELHPWVTSRLTSR